MTTEQLKKFDALMSVMDEAVDAMTEEEVLADEHSGAHLCDWCDGEDGAHETCCPESPDYEPPDPDLNAPDAQELYERAWSEGRNPR